MKFNDGGNIEAMMAQMAGGQQPQQPQGGGGEPAFIMPGQEASPIQIDQERRDQGIEPHQFVIFSGPEGEEVQVYGDWETYGSPNQEGQISGEDYPISRGENGEYVLNAEEFEAGMTAGDSEAAMAGQAQGGPGASKTQDLMEMLSDAGGPPQMRNGGVVKAYTDGGELESESRRKQRQAVRAVRRDTRRRNRFVESSIRSSADTGEFLEKLGGPGIKESVKEPLIGKKEILMALAMAGTAGLGDLASKDSKFSRWFKRNR